MVIAAAVLAAAAEEVFSDGDSCLFKAFISEIAGDDDIAVVRTSWCCGTVATLVVEEEINTKIMKTRMLLGFNK